MKRFTVRFMPEGVSVQVDAGTDLLRAATLAGISIRSNCGGEGTCGRCAVLVKEGHVAAKQGHLPHRLKEAGYVQACSSLVEGDAVVEVPEASRLADHRVLLDKMSRGEVLAEESLEGLERYPVSPLAFRVALRMDPPTLTDCAADLVRLRAHLRKAGIQGEILAPRRFLQGMPETLRQGEWGVTLSLSRASRSLEAFGLKPGCDSSGPGVGLAVDIGTTTIVTYLVDLATGAILDSRGTYNRQALFGDDVINRIIHATENPGGLRELQEACVETINGLVRKASRHRGIEPGEIQAACVAGNTTMTHLFMGVSPRYIRLEPYIPAATDFPPVPASELGLQVHPEAPVWAFPAVASYVGGDIVSGVLATGMAHREEVSLFIDIGTNGEMVLGNCDWLVSCACSAGPCFEGSGITSGMRAIPGAIERLEIEPGTLDCHITTVGGSEPKGICGSGLVDALAEMRRAGIIDRSGSFLMDGEHPRLVMGEDGPEYLVVPGLYGETGQDIVITENDVKNLLRAKGAVYAGIRSLLRAVDLPLEAISRIYIAGGFGNYLNIRDSVEIGLLPDVDPGLYTFVGNTSIKGARLALMSQEARDEALELGQKMTYLELSVGTTFMEEYVSAMFIPHTDMGLFPSVTGAGPENG